MITDFWGHAIVEKKGCGISAFKKAESARKYHSSPKGKINRRKHSRRSIFKIRYGITLEKQANRLEAQGGKCGICKTSDFGERGPHTDHCHKTGVFRGVLCFRCNAGLGSFRDNTEFLEAAIKYLQQAEVT